MNELKEFLQKKIKGCDELGDMDKEKWAFLQCLKEVEKINVTTKVQVNAFKKKIVCVHTDGACKNNPGKGGWGFIINNNGNFIYPCSGKHLNTTNNRMEIQAVIEVFKKYKNHKGCYYKIYSDSKYVVKTIMNGWQKKVNTDLWDEFDKVSSGFIFELIWEGRDSSQGNIEANKLAQIEAGTYKGRR